METIKTRLVHDRISGRNRYITMWHGIETMVIEDGLMGIYKGLIPTMLRQGGTQATRYSVYNWAKVFLGDYFGYIPSIIMAGMLAGACGIYVTNPIDVIKTNMQGESSHNFVGVYDCYTQIVEKEGYRGFYKGTTPRLFRILLESSLTFALFETIISYLDMIPGW